MSDEIQPAVEEEKTTTSTSFYPLILFFSIGFVILIIVFGYGYYQLSRVNLSLARQWERVEKNNQGIETKLASLEKSITALQTSQQAVSQQAAVVPSKAVTVNLDDLGRLQLIARLTDINATIDSLPPAVVSTNHPSEPIRHTWWKQRVDQLWLNLQKIVVIRRNAMGTLPSSASNIHLQLQAAIWAVSHHQSATYQNNLAEAIASIKQQFSLDHPAVKQVLSDLTALKNQNVK